MRARAYTLLEVLVVVAILGTAAAMVVPSMSSAGNLRIQAAVREMVADITFAQSDAVAYQTRRAIVFFESEGRYVLCEVRGSVIDPDVDALFDITRDGARYDVTFDEDRTAGAAIIEVDFDGDNILIFDELGGPVETATGDRPSSGGVIRIRDAIGQTFRITVEAYTGRVLVERE
ncbi:MAG: prepilin-type N-terminal cleavage/methylation domain-containing protein [Phycisphaera sp.]|nr:MAG: prepilin-type N-terminal cleavage/methylation domain-containing protein [Phycisphaera sp.]